MEKTSHSFTKWYVKNHKIHLILQIDAAQLKPEDISQVQTKGVSQCVDFYYHSKRLREKQRKLKEKEAQQQQQQTATETLTSTNQVKILYKINKN